MAAYSAGEAGGIAVGSELLTRQGIRLDSGESRVSEALSEGLPHPRHTADGQPEAAARGGIQHRGGWFSRQGWLANRCPS